MSGAARLVVMAALAAGSLAAPAREAAPLADDPRLEAQVLQVAEELRCLVCQNETIAASQATLAVDLRQQIRVQLGEGKTPAQIRDFMVERYGDFVRYRPAFNTTTALLWTGPFALLIAAVTALALKRRHAPAAPLPLSDAERQRLRALLDGAPAP